MMAAKLRASTAMVTMLGCDSFGKDTLENYKLNGVNIGALFLLVDESVSETLMCANRSRGYDKPGSHRCCPNHRGPIRYIITLDC